MLETHRNVRAQTYLLCHILWEGERFAKTEGIQWITVPYTLRRFFPHLFTLCIIVSRNVREMYLNNILTIVSPYERAVFQNNWICVKDTIEAFLTSREARTRDTDQPKQMLVGATYRFLVCCLSPNYGSKYDSKCLYKYIYMHAYIYIFAGTLSCISLHQIFKTRSLGSQLNLSALHAWLTVLFPLPPALLDFLSQQQESLRTGAQEEVSSAGCRPAAAHTKRWDVCVLGATVNLD